MPHFNHLRIHCASAQAIPGLLHASFAFRNTSSMRHASCTGKLCQRALPCPPALAALFPTDVSLNCSETPHATASAVCPGNILQCNSICKIEYFKVQPLLFHPYSDIYTLLSIWRSGDKKHMELYLWQRLKNQLRVQW